MRYLPRKVAVLFIAGVLSITPSLRASANEGKFDLNWFCEEKTLLSGNAFFLLDQQADSEFLQLILQRNESAGDYFVLTLEHLGGALGTGTFALGKDEAVTGFLTKSENGNQLSGDVDSGELSIKQSAPGNLSGTLQIFLSLKNLMEMGPDVICSAGGTFSAIPGVPDTLSAIPGVPDTLMPGYIPPEEEPAAEDDMGEPEQSCLNGPKPGNWSLTVGQMTVLGIFTPLGGGAQIGAVQSIDGGAKITADFAGVGQLEFEPFSGSWAPLTGRMYQATKLPSAFGDGIYWYLSCDSSTSMLSTSGIKDSHRRGGPPHVQFHNWKAN